MGLNQFFKECHEKGVVKMLSIYILSSWIILQVLSVIQDPLGLPVRIITYFIIALLIAFPVYIYYIWRFRLAPKEKKLSKTDGFHRMYFTGLGITAFFSFIIAFLISVNNFASEVEIPLIEPTNKIAVLEFGNNTGEENNDILGKMAADWIIHGITANQVAEVISPELVTSYASLVNNKPSGGDKNFLIEYFKPGMIISGNFYQEGEQLYLQSQIIDGNNDKVIIAFKNQNCALNEPLECIEALKQVILSFLATKDNPANNLQDDSPTFEAYQYLLNAKALSNDSDKYLDLLNKSIEADPNYFEPIVLKVAYYYNAGEYKTADSLLKAIDETTYNDNRQQNLLSLYENLLKGNNRKIFQSMMKEYQLTPDELGTNASAMVIALQFVNKPELADDIYNEVEKSINELDNCQECRSRVYIKALADIQLGKYNEVIELMLPVTESSDEEYLQKPLLSAYVRGGWDKELTDYFENKKLRLTEENLFSLYLMVGKEYLLKDDAEKASLYLDKVIKNKEVDKSLRAEAYYFLEDFVKAERLYEDIIAESPENREGLSRLAAISSKLGDTEGSNTYLRKLNSLRDNYQFGLIEYQIAVYHIMQNDWVKANEYLLKSIALGNTYNPENFQNDPHFRNYINTPEFQKILTYWH